MAKQKYYAVFKGRCPGIYLSWDECQQQVKGFKGADFKSYPTEGAAKDAFKQINSRLTENPISDSIAVDASCMGNPGIVEYRGVFTETGVLFFENKNIGIGTNNLGEFLAIVHALSLLKKENKNTLIYSDSKTAMAWVRNKKVKSVLDRTEKTKTIWQLVDRALIWLLENTYENKIEKWPTELWGEIPADYDRK